MPEFLPTPNLPQGLAAETLRLAAARGQNNPWAALAQSLGSSIQQWGAQTARPRPGPTLTPEQLNALQLLPPMRAAGPVQPGQPPLTQSPDARDVFPKGAPMSLAENLLQRKTQADIAREATSRMMGIQDSKNKEKQLEDLIPLTPETRATLKKRGIVLPNSMDSVHRSLLSSEIKPPSASVDLRDKQFWEKQWVEAGKELDITKASSRTPLGVAVTNNQKAGRAMKLLDSNKIFSPQDLSLITTDLTAMMKGGSPDEELLRQQQYRSLYQSGVALLQRITAKPQDLKIPEVKEHLREVINGIVEVDNQVIRDHVDSVEFSRSDVISRRPKDWERAKARALQHVIADKTDKKADNLDALIDKHLGGK